MAIRNHAAACAAVLTLYSSCGQVAAANFLEPGGTVTTDIDGEDPSIVSWPVIDWARNSPGSGYAQWDTFTVPFGPPGADENTPDFGDFNAADAQVEQTVQGGFITSGGNIYSFSSATAFEVTMPGNVVSPGSDAYFVAQIATLGNVIATPSVTLSYGDTFEELPFDGSLLTEDFESFGQSQTTVFYWQLNGVDPNNDFLLKFAAGGSSMSLDQLVIDTLTVGGSAPGDLDGNGAVEIADYLAWRDNFGTAGPGGDGNADGIVDAADFTLWRDNYAASGAGVVAVPEPSTFTALLVLGLSLAFVGGVDWFNRPKRAAKEAQS
ncbi:MAG: hypothetical protein AAGJ46_03485 [Planctomycetota bacterium]